MKQQRLIIINTCQKLIAPKPNIAGISQFHNNITTALNPAAIAKNPIEVKNLFILVFITFQFYGLTFVLLRMLSNYADK